MSLFGIITALAPSFGRDGARDLDAWCRPLDRPVIVPVQDVVAAGYGETMPLSDSGIRHSSRFQCVAGRPQSPERSGACRRLSFPHHAIAEHLAAEALWLEHLYSRESLAA
ncbi:MAG: hypothetical protein QM581_16425 [Pseudomonas sp.]